MSNSLLLYISADKNGMYQFDSLSSGNYIVRFRSTSEDIHTYEVEISLSDNQTYEQDIYLLYRKIDEFNALKKSKDVFLIKFQPEGGKIGSNHRFVDYLSGTFIGDETDKYTLSSDIFKAPDQFNWETQDSLLTPDYIRMNYQFVVSVDESSFNGLHEIRFYGEDIIKILSNPSNGFIFIKKNDIDKELMIPCVDFINNDFGLIINYN